MSHNKSLSSKSKVPSRPSHVRFTRAQSRAPSVSSDSPGAEYLMVSYPRLNRSKSVSPPPVSSVARNLDDAPEDSGSESTLVDMELSNLTLRCSGGAKQPPSHSFGENVSMNDSPIVNEDTTQPTQDERYADVEERARRYNISAEMIY